MMHQVPGRFLFAILLGSLLSSRAAPQIDPIANASVPAGKSIIIPVTGNSPNGRPLSYTATSSTNRITVEVHTNNPFWKMCKSRRRTRPVRIKLPFVAAWRP
jgi:hypothetical protein